MTLGFCVRDDKVLLGFKEKGFGAQRWNGFGGKVEPGESIEQCLVREFTEESGLGITKFEKRAVHEYVAQRNPGEILEVHTFLVQDWEGDTQETEDFRTARWFLFADIPYDHMWPDDRLWLPQFLEGKCLKTTFFFGENDAVLKYEVSEVGRTELE